MIEIVQLNFTDFTPATLLRPLIFHLNFPIGKATKEFAIYRFYLNCIYIYIFFCNTIFLYG